MRIARAVVGFVAAVMLAAVAHHFVEPDAPFQGEVWGSLFSGFFFLIPNLAIAQLISKSNGLTFSLGVAITALVLLLLVVLLISGTYVIERRDGMNWIVDGHLTSAGWRGFSANLIATTAIWFVCGFVFWLIARPLGSAREKLGELKS